MPFLPARDTNIYYTESGPADGRPLLLLHASLQTAESMDPVRDALAPLGPRVIQPDLRGHGRTANPGGGLSIAALADDMAQLMQALGMDRPVCAGFSLGGIVAIELARRGLLSGLVVLASRISPAPAGRTAFDPAFIQKRSPIWAKQLAQKHVEMPWDQLSSTIGAMLESFPGFDQAALGSIAVPTLVLQGDRDQMVPLEQGQELARQVPGGQFFLVPRSGHPELIYRPDAMAQVFTFVQRVSQS